jgi:hypothetical protein
METSTTTFRYCSRDIPVEGESTLSVISVVSLWSGPRASHTHPMRGIQKGDWGVGLLPPLVPGPGGALSAISACAMRDLDVGSPSLHFPRKNCINRAKGEGGKGERLGWPRPGMRVQIKASPNRRMTHDPARLLQDTMRIFRYKPKK